MYGTYYGIAGANGYGVYSNYTKVLQTKPYVKKYKVKKFDTFIGARDYAIEMYYILQNSAKPFFIIEEKQRLNWFHRK